MRGFSFLFLLAAPFALGCSPHASNALQNGRVTNFTSCALPKDQGIGSLHGHWASLPVPIVFDKDFYMADGGAALPSLRNAMQSWNLWGTLRGRQAFTLRNDGVGINGGRDIPPLTDCAQASYTSSVTDAVGIWKITGAGAYHRNTRDSCGANLNGGAGKIMPIGVQGQTDWIIQNSNIVGASILLNFEEFNSPGQRLIDVESLLLHELGHVLGLLHSCNGSTQSSSDSTTAPACSTGGVISAPLEYTNAVMFPFLEVGQSRRQLQQNDYSRINCLY